jgi:uncharacterized protein (TIGR00730 family)
MPSIASVCVYCGSSLGANPRHTEAARHLGTQLATHGIRLVYGGGRIGLMGQIADAVLAGGGQVIGVIPEHLQVQEKGHHGVTELHVVASMHERKNLMFELSDAFVILPGGFGTLDEAFEMLTWRADCMTSRSCCWTVRLLTPRPAQRTYRPAGLRQAGGAAPYTVIDDGGGHPALRRAPARPA